MGAAESSLSPALSEEQRITTVTERTEEVDPVLERLKSLKIATPILTAPPTESSLTDLLVRKPSSSSTQGQLNSKVILELFSIYRDWQEAKSSQISKRQEEIENQIDIVDALAVKLHQRFSYSVAAMKATSQHLSEAQALAVEIGGLKGKLTEVISNCDALCKRISTEGPISLRSTVKPFTEAAASGDLGKTYNVSSSSGLVNTRHPSKDASV